MRKKYNNIDNFLNVLYTYPTITQNQSLILMSCYTDNILQIYPWVLFSFVVKHFQGDGI